MHSVLEFKNIGKLFGKVRALSQVSFSVRPEKIVVLMGENGAGKSTLMKILSGVWPSGSYEGQMFLDGKEIQFQDTRQAHSAGIAMIHQELSVFKELTIAEHLELDQLPTVIQWDKLFERTQKFLDTLNFGLNAKTQVGKLPIGGRQLVEIARALYRDARVLVFDEPTSALTDAEVKRLYQVLDQLRASGKAIIYITHRMDEVFRLADRIVVLRDGQFVKELPVHDNSGKKIAREVLEPELIRLMVGREIQDIYPRKKDFEMEAAQELLRVEDLSLIRPSGRIGLENVNFTLHKGEIFGLAGLLGSGRSETFEHLFGVLNPEGPRARGYQISGKVFLKGSHVNLKRPSEALRSRMAFVSEDRKGSGLVLGHSIRENLSLPFLAQGNSRESSSLDHAKMASGGSLLSRISTEKEKTQITPWINELKLKFADLEQPVGQLSGGNQQKVVLAKWLLTDPEILFLDEPTRGIDIGAKTEIYHWIQELARRGMGIIVASSEMPELIGLCHRVLVLREGRVSAELKEREITQERMMAAAAL